MLDYNSRQVKSAASDGKINLPHHGPLFELLDGVRKQSLCTGQLAHALIYLRNFLPKEHLLHDWCDAVAHYERDRGTMCLTATGIWQESLWILDFLRPCEEESGVLTRPVPARFFKTAIKLIGNGEVDLEGERPGELIQRLSYLYSPRKDEGGTIVAYSLDNPKETLEGPENRVMHRAIGEHLRRGITLETPDGSELMNLLNDALEGYIGDRLNDEQCVSWLLPHFLALFHRTRTSINRAPEIDATLLLDLNADNLSSEEYLGLNLAFHPSCDLEDTTKMPTEYTNNGQHCTHDYGTPYLTTRLSSGHFLAPELRKDYLNRLFDPVRAGAGPNRSLIQRDRRGLPEGVLQPT